MNAVSIYMKDSLFIDNLKGDFTALVLEVQVRDVLPESFDLECQNRYPSFTVLTGCAVY